MFHSYIDFLIDTQRPNKDKLILAVALNQAMVYSVWIRWVLIYKKITGKSFIRVHDFYNGSLVWIYYQWHKPELMHLTSWYQWNGKKIASIKEQIYDAHAIKTAFKEIIYQECVTLLSTDKNLKPFSKGKNKSYQEVGNTVK